MFRYLGSSSVIIDEFTVSNADDIAQAQAHLVASTNSLSETDLDNLLSYVSSLDQVSAPSDDEINIFENSDSPDTVDEPETCFPVKAKATGKIVIICF